VKLDDAPQPGWYPDPEGGVRLRWWDGTDWTDRYRSRPSAGEVALAEAAARAAAPPAVPAGAVARRTMGGLDRSDAEALLSEVRQVARSEAERAADLLGQRAAVATRQLTPLVTQYANRALRWLRILVIGAFVLAVAWFAFQVIAQVSFAEWLGDRIDNLTNR
jgi:hypothetical protein